MAYDQANKDLSRYEQEGPKGEVSRWLREIELVEDSAKHRQFETVGKRIVRKFKAEDAMRAATQANPKPGGMMFNVLWSNVRTLRTALFARLPKTQVERRFKDSNPRGRRCSLIAERCTDYVIDSQQDRVMAAIKQAVQNRLLPGRGQVRLRFEAEFEPAVDEEGYAIEDEEGSPIEQVKPLSERIYIDPVQWLDYIESPARNQYEVRWRAFRFYLTREELVARFGDVGKKVTLTETHTGKSSDDIGKPEEEFLCQAEVWEVQDIVSKHIVWVSPGYKEAPLDKKKNPLQLEGFWSCPIPLLATTTDDSTYPTPDYIIYEGLAEEVDYATKRLKAMLECIRLVGMTAAQHNTDVKSMLALSDGQLLAMKNWPKFASDGGLNGIVDWLPFDRCVEAIPEIMKYRDDTLLKLDQITGQSDLTRGMADPRETAKSIQSRSAWLDEKVAESQEDVQRFCREIYAKVCEMIFEPGFFSDETIMLMCGFESMSPEDQEEFPADLALLRSDKLRTFVVGIETDSTLAMDEVEERQARMEYLQAMGGIIEKIEIVKQASPELIRPLVESALFASASFRAGRQVEGAWERYLREIEEQERENKENPQPPPPDPAMLKVQLDGQKLEHQKMIDVAKLRQTDAKNMAELVLEERRLLIDESGALNRMQLDKMALDLEAFKNEFVRRTEEVKSLTKLAETEQKTRAAEAEADIKKRATALDALMDQQRIELDKKWLDLEAHNSKMKATEMFLEERRLATEVREKRVAERESKQQPSKETAKPRRMRGRMRKSADGSAEFEVEDL